MVSDFFKEKICQKLGFISKMSFKIIILLKRLTKCCAVTKKLSKEGAE